MRLRRAIRTVGIVIAVLLSLEGLAALTERSSKYRLCQATGYELVPGYRSERENVNAAGLRGAETSPRRAGCLRLLCMGESTTWGHRMQDDEAWPAVLQRRLAAEGLDVEVLNGGVSGWGLEQIDNALHVGLLARLQPDVVLIYAGWNAPRLEHNAQVERMRRQLEPVSRSAAVRWLERFVGRWEDEPAGQGRPHKKSAEAASEAFPALLPELAEACAKHGARLALVRFPALAQRPVPQDAEALARFESLLREGGGAPDARLETLATEEAALHAALLAAVQSGAAAAHVPLLDLAGALEASLPEDRTQADRQWAGWFMDRMHFTPPGNAAVAQALIGPLREAGLLAPAR